VEVRKTMTGKYQIKDLVYNVNTKEDGAIRKVYEMNGARMYEAAVPVHGDSWVSGFYISDWSEGVLQPSSNERLKSSTFQEIGSNIFS
jgi:hypothetical protein